MAPHASYSSSYASMMADHDRIQGISRTKTGLQLLIIGLLIGPVPYVGIIGGIIVLVGAILVIVGRKPFGPTHSRNTIWSIIIYIVGIAIVIGASVAFALSVISATISNSMNGTFNPSVVSQALTSSFNVLLIGAVIGGAVSGIASVLFTYALQNRNGRILLWAGYGAGLVVSIVVFLIISQQLTSVFQQATSGGAYNPAPISALQFQQSLVGLLGLIPAVLYATALYLVWSRIGRGELPASRIQAS